MAALPRGHKEATSIPELAHRFNVSGREIRQGLERLVIDRHVAVVTLPCRRGVFIAATPEELDAGLAHIDSKAWALLRRRRALRMCREQLAWSPTLFQI